MISLFHTEPQWRGVVDRCRLAQNTMGIVAAAFMSVVAGSFLRAAAPVDAGRESQVYSINQSAPHSSPVAFSVSYPKGWTMWENKVVLSDNLGDLASPIDPELVCKFESPLDHAPPADPRTIIMVTNYASITVFRGHGATAKAEAEDLAGRLRKMGDEVQDLVSTKTAAGDAGYLLMCTDDTPRGHRLRSELFFNIGSKGHIRISIYVMGTFLGMRESLQNLVLESLRFPQVNESLHPTTR